MVENIDGASGIAVCDDANRSDGFHRRWSIIASSPPQPTSSTSSAIDQIGACELWRTSMVRQAR